MAKYSIELDCPPLTGPPRQDDLFPQLFAETELTEADFELVLQFLGRWVWNLKPGKEPEYERARPMIKARISEFYRAGYIRYGEW